MILSASRRTDIPAFFADWFMNRLREGFALVRNPMNYRQVSKLELSPAVLDCIVFWTKNPRPLLPYLKEIGESYPFYFQYTLNAYGKDVEQRLPDVGERVRTLRTLSDAIGKDRVIWRYDPVLLSPIYDLRWHAETFGRMAKTLAPFIGSAVFSYYDAYPKAENNIRGQQARPCRPEEMEALAREFSSIAKANRLTLKTCAEAVDLEKYGIGHNRCIDPALIEKMTGWAIHAKKDANQRPECGCAESVDIGQYNTCRHGCRYCYANFSPKSVETFLRRHDKNSPLLIGRPESADTITPRKMKPLRTERGAAGAVLY